MFIGHYGVAFGAKRAAPQVPLWAFVLAAQLVDVAWTIFILIGVEHVRIAPGITAGNPLDFYDYPYTHSLVGALFWSGLAYVGWRLLTRRRGSVRGGLWLAAVVFSHWLLDLLVHRPDLELLDSAHKVGLGLWNVPWLELGLEIALLLAGLIWYLRGTQSQSRLGRWGFWALAGLLILVQLGNFFGPPPTSVTMIGVAGLSLYLIVVGLAAWLERYRMPQLDDSTNLRQQSGP